MFRCDFRIEPDRMDSLPVPCGEVSLMRSSAKVSERPLPIINGLLAGMIFIAVSLMLKETELPPAQREDEVLRSDPDRGYWSSRPERTLLSLLTQLLARYWWAKAKIFLS